LIAAKRAGRAQAMELGFNEIVRKLLIEKLGDYALRGGRASTAIPINRQIRRKKMYGHFVLIYSALLFQCRAF
jgi:hypothetical protein